MQGDSIVPNTARVTRQNSMGMLRDIVTMAGKGCSVTVLSYSVTDGWMRQLLKLRREMGISNVTVVLDRTVMTRHRQLLAQLQNVADDIYLTDSHAKAYVACGKEYEIAVITSANATQNYRNECYYSTDRPGEIQRIKDDIGDILRQSYRIG